jgi:hypothetical protein
MRAAMLAVALVVVATRPAHADRGAEVDAIRKAAASCDKDRAHCFGVQLYVVADDADGLIVTAEWIANQLAMANRHFAPLDVGFQLASVDVLPAASSRVETRRDRDAIAADRLGGKLISVFVVGELDNVDEDGVIYGVTWHHRKDDRKYVILSARAWERTLAHELGHFFGLPHSTYAISIMNKQERKEPPMAERTFADEEVAAMKPALRRLVRDKVIVEMR